MARGPDEDGGEAIAVEIARARDGQAHRMRSRRPGGAPSTTKTAAFGPDDDVPKTRSARPSPSTSPAEAITVSAAASGVDDAGSGSSPFGPPR